MWKGITLTHATFHSKSKMGDLQFSVCDSTKYIIFYMRCFFSENREGVALKLYRKNINQYFNEYTWMRVKLEYMPWHFTNLHI